VAVVRGVLLATLAVAAAFNLGLALALVWRPDELRYGEAILYDHAARLLRGEALYQPLDGPPYTIANYPPVYYLVVAGLRLLSGDGFAAGRLVSLVSGLVIALLVAWLVWGRTRSWWASLTGGLVFIGLGIGGIVPWSAALKADLLGVAFGMGSVAVLDSVRSRMGVAGAAGLAAAAILTKQSLVGPAVFGTLWLLACRPRAAPLFAGTAVAVTLVTAVTVEATTGAFLANTVGSNLQPPFSRVLFEHNLRELATYQAIPALIAVAAVLTSKLHRDLLVMNWLGSLIPMLPLGVYGADANYWLHFAAASASLASIALWRWRDQAVGLVAAGALAAQALVATGSVARWHLERPGFLVGPSTAQAALAPLVERVRSANGTVLADPLDVVVLANRPIFIEPTDFGIRERAGTWDSTPIVELLCTKQVPLVILGYAVDDVGERWPASLVTTMQRTLVLDATVPLANRARWVYVPDPNAEDC
jgi:hypothetical protein